MNDLSPVAITRHGAVALITMPAAQLDQSIRTALLHAVEAVANDPAIGAVILTGSGLFFSNGASPKDGSRPSLGEICRYIENLEKPVVAALQGAAFGQGIELALAAHWRVALAQVRLGFSEIRIGLVAGAGATQRLPRMIGAGPALRLLQSGETLSATDGLALGLLDEVVQTGLDRAAMAAAQSLLGKDTSPYCAANRQAGRQDFSGFQAAMATERARLAADPAALPAAHRIADCVEAALLLPMEQGLAFEAAAREEFLDAPEVQGLSYAALVERNALRRFMASARPAPILLQKLAFVGTVGVELVVQLLNAGLQVRLVEPDRDRLVGSLGKIAAMQESKVQARRLAPEARDADWARLIPTLTMVEAEDADLWLCAPDARFGHVKANRPLQIMLGGVGAGQSGIGLFAPSSAGKLAELCVSAADEGCGQAIALCQKLGWRVVISGAGGGIERRLRASLNAAISAQEAGGLTRPMLAVALASVGLGLPLAHQGKALPSEAADVVNACLCALANEGARLVEEGVALCPGDVDAVAFLTGLVPRRLGGPMNWADQRGLLVLRADLLHRAVLNPAHYTPVSLIDQLIREERSFADLNRI